MAALVVHNMDEKVKARIQRMAKRKGHSMSAEVREILAEATKREKKASTSRRRAAQSSEKQGLGTEIANMFRGRGLTFEIPEFRGQPDRSVRFDE